MFLRTVNLQRYEISCYKNQCNAPATQEITEYNTTSTVQIKIQQYNREWINRI